MNRRISLGCKAGEGVSSSSLAGGGARPTRLHSVQARTVTNTTRAGDARRGQKHTSKPPDVGTLSPLEAAVYPPLS